MNGGEKLKAKWIYNDDFIVEIKGAH